MLISLFINSLQRLMICFNQMNGKELSEALSQLSKEEKANFERFILTFEVKHDCKDHQ